MAQPKTSHYIPPPDLHHKTPFESKTENDQKIRGIERSKELQSTDTILVIEPIGFRYNPDAAIDNLFAHQSELTPEEDERLAMHEFNGFVDALTSRGVNVLRFPGDESTPDAVYPDWLLTFYDKESAKHTFVVCPMSPVNRRLERRPDIIQHFRRYFDILDLTHFENEVKALEGKGALVISRRTRKAFINLTERASREVAVEICRRGGFELIEFHAHDGDGNVVYHTDVVMTIGTNFIVICEEAIRDADELASIKNALEPLELTWINISLEQMGKFCANIRELKISQENAGPYYFHRGARRHDLKTFNRHLLIVIMSQQAYLAFTREQRHALRACVSELVPVPLYHIERIGGGSARCMIAEVFH